MNDQLIEKLCNEATKGIPPIKVPFKEKSAVVNWHMGIGACHQPDDEKSSLAMQNFEPSLRYSKSPYWHKQKKKMKNGQFLDQ